MALEPLTPNSPMLYAVLCYNSEDLVGSWTKEQDDEVMVKLIAVQEKVAKKGKLGPVARLKFTKTARTLRKGLEPPLITDGPYAETKEALLGFYIVDCEDDDEAMDFARDLARVNPGGAYEVRPVSVFIPGAVLAL